MFKWLRDLYLDAKILRFTSEEFDDFEANFVMEICSAAISFLVADIIGAFNYVC